MRPPGRLAYLVGFLFAVALLAGGCNAYSSAFKIKKLEEKSRHEALKLNGEDFDLFTEAPRNYSLFVTLTALAPEMGCAPCRQFDSEFKLVASSWGRVAVPGKLYFGTLDFSDGREVFQKLSVTNVPMVLHFPPTEGPDATGSDQYELYDLNRRGLSAEAFVEHVEKAAHVKFQLRRPINFAYYATVAISIFGLLALVKLVAGHLLALVQNRKIWSTAVIGWTVLMCSGHMWNSIRGPPYTGVRDNRPEIVAPGFQNQFVLESQIVGLLYAAAAVMFVALVTKTPGISDPAMQRTAVLGFVFGFIVLYSFLLRFFRLKNGSYPFKLLF
ncbi:hypothetical protein SpCBS45565_g05588 [Spizellomyces sp. 'palustris']|nr:hypothetical protein SpCBS45565_g05588 [Spizellomyces sp. 'palustris']